MSDDLRENFSEAVWEKAKSVKLEDLSRSINDETMWFVTSQRTGKQERVQFVGDYWVTCSCQNGSRRGGQAECYHAASALMARDSQTYQKSLEEEQE